MARKGRPPFLRPDSGSPSRFPALVLASTSRRAPDGTTRAFWMPCGVVYQKGGKAVSRAYSVRNTAFGSSSRGRAGTCQETCITVNIRLHRFKQFLRLYILLNVTRKLKMYNLKKCNTMRRRMLTVMMLLYVFDNRDVLYSYFVNHD